jgi:drug/metabolite transporter (DMT)-like permease
MGFLYILLVVLGITTVALMAKLSAIKKVPALDLSLVIFIVSTIFSAVLAATKLHGFPGALFTSTVIIVAGLAGAGGAIAVFAFNHAVRLGHFGFSNAIYRSSFLIPVVAAVIFFDAAIKITTITGILLILLGIFLMSWSADSFGKGNQAEFRWFLIIMLGFLLSGMPRLGQLLASSWNQNYFIYLLISYASGVLALCVPALSMKKVNLPAFVYGSIAGLASYVAVYCTLKSLEVLKATVVFPITLSGPIILGVLLSLIIFREKIKVWGWAGIVSGITGIIVLAIWK